ncbi:MAG: SDR family oxidoreductase [Planctomycetota bacterium]|jgi:NAD(P)-dependent dehydrogenase (short-subunit alcohol dehydrogenase family)|nr:SDR family oxidoreductase [Planctomycetota bacterium]
MTENPEQILEGRCALITGGSRGLGRALCCKFTAEGARVAFTYLNNDDAANETRAMCKEAGGEALVYKVPVTDREATGRMVEDIEEKWGGIDILVNNAAVTQALPIALMEEEDWDYVMDTNVKGVFLTTRTVLRGMIRSKGGVILNIGSLAGVRMMEAPLHYYTSKAAIKGLTECLAKEVARYGIRVICLAPGLLEEGVGRNLPDHRLADYLKHCSLGRVGRFGEVARFAAFLVSDANTYMTGETVIIDGGV